MAVIYWDLTNNLKFANNMLEYTHPFHELFTRATTLTFLHEIMPWRTLVQLVDENKSLYHISVKTSVTTAAPAWKGFKHLIIKINKNIEIDLLGFLREKYVLAEQYFLSSHNQLAIYWVTALEKCFFLSPWEAAIVLTSRA